MVDPDDPLAFVTSLRFNYANLAIGAEPGFTMTAMTEQGITGIPEPSALTILGLGLLCFGAVRRRKKPAA